MQDWPTIQNTFREIWGYDDFRPPQDQVIRSLLSGQDALIVMPTGSGKSVCFQLPALLQRGLTLVVSPLIALMENQVKELQQKNLAAQILHSQLGRAHRQQVLGAIENARLKLLYLSPETLLSQPVWSRLVDLNLRINGLILDEAHCLAEWGDTFRPAYRRLGVVRPALLRHKPKGSKMAIAAFTATANLQTQKTITKILRLKSPKKFLQSPYRKNIHITSRTIWTPRGKREELKKFIQRHPKQSGLIYGRSRRDIETLARDLCKQGHRTVAYHGGLSPGDRRQREKDWLSNKLQFIVCTNAFGLGINKPDVRWIVHWQTPSLLTEYVQEIGRAGRDGKRSDVLSLISEPSGLFNPEDKKYRQFFFDNLKRNIRQAKTLAQKLPVQGSITDLPDKKAALSLSILHSAGQLIWLDPFNYQRVGKINDKAFDFLIKKQAKKIQQLTDFWFTKNCRWQYILNAFGFQSEAKDFHCGHCDYCLRKS